MYRNITFAIAALALITIGCEKSSKDDSVRTLPTAVFNDNLEKAKQIFAIDPTIYNSLQKNLGVLIQISPNSFVDAQGSLVTDEVSIEFVFLSGRTSMLMLGKNTNGMRSSGVVQTMVSGGQYYLNAYSSGEQVFLNQEIVVKVAVEYGGTGHSEMRKFDGGSDLTGDPVWELALDSLIPIDTVLVDSIEGANIAGYVPVYSILENDWGWTNIDRWYYDSRPKTQLYVQVPEGYSPENCEVYLSYDGEPNALASFDSWDADLEMFTEHYGQIPIGVECHFIAVTMIDEVLHYAIKGNTIEEDHVEVIEEWRPTTQAELADLINALP